jgi:hypothetical protein
MSDSKNPNFVLDTPCAWVHAPREASRGGKQAPSLILEAAGSTWPLLCATLKESFMIAKFTGDLESCQRNLQNEICKM